MDSEAMAVKLAEVDSRSRENEKNIKDLKRNTDVLTRLATSVEVMASEQKHQTESMVEIKNDVAALGTKVDTMEQRPANEARDIKSKVINSVIGVIVGAIVTLILVKLGIS